VEPRQFDATPRENFDAAPASNENFDLTPAFLYIKPFFLNQTKVNLSG
jgi:hypothetical protein